MFLRLLALSLLFSCCAPAELAQHEELSTESTITDVDESPKVLECSTNSGEHQDNEFHICGVISAEVVDKLETLLVENTVTKIVIDSPGGSSIDAVRLVSIANELGIEFHLTGRCASACAQFILMLANDVWVEKDTFIAFHETATAQLEVFVRSNLVQDKENFSELKKMSELEINAYKNSNVGTEMLIHPFASMGLQCVENLTRDNSGQYKSFNISARWVSWTPNRKFLEDTRGSSIGGWYPNNRYDHFRVGKLRFPNAPSRHVFRFLEKGADLNRNYKLKVERCVSEE